MDIINRNQLLHKIQEYIPTEKISFYRKKSNNVYIKRQYLGGHKKKYR